MKQVHIKTLFKQMKSRMNLSKSFGKKRFSMLDKEIKINQDSIPKVHETARHTKESKVVNWSNLFSKDFEFKIKETKETSNGTGIKAVIFDINNVLLGFDKAALASIGKDLRQILKCSVWDSYLNGTYTKEEAISKITSELNFSSAYIEKVLEEARKSFVPIEENIFLLQKLKEEGKTLICLSNCPKDEIDLVRRRFNFFDNFDLILTSGDVGVNKPNKEAFKRVLNYSNLQPEEVCYIDDDAENVKSAGEMGIKGVQYTGFNSIKELEGIILNSQKKNEKLEKIEKNEKNEKISKIAKNYAKAYNYLTKQADLDDYGLFVSTVGLGESSLNKQSPSEMFATVMALLTSKQLCLSPVGNRILSFIKKTHDNGKFKFFVDLDVIPYDVDTTSLSASLLYKHGLFDEKEVNSTIDQILANHNENQIIITFFDPHRYRLCPIVCANALYLIHQAGREENQIAKNSKKYILDFLASGEYVEGCTYYPNPDFFLYSIAKLVHMYPNNFADFKPVLIKEISQRIGSKNPADNNTISLANRVICSKLFDIPNPEEFNKLLSLQLPDGSWEESPIYTTSKKKNGNVFYWSNRALSTVFGMKAIELEMFGKRQFL